MTDTRIAATCASGLFVLMIALGLAAADKPPPVGFLGLAVLLAVLSFLVYLRLRSYLSARRSHVSGLTGRAAIEGFAVGLLLIALLTMVSSGEPSVTPTLGSRLIGFALGGAVGAGFAAAAYAIAAWLQRFSRQ